MSKDLKAKIEESLKSFKSGNLYESSINLFSTLGYNTSRTMPLKKTTWQEFKEDFTNEESKFDDIKAKVNEWKYVNLLFQLTRQEISHEQFGYEGVITVGEDKVIIETYLFFVIDLSGESYSRTALSAITREVNNVFSMPAMILFKHGDTLTLSVINRRLHRRDPGKDVLKKVTLIKDINIFSPHRGHVDILFDLSLSNLLNKYTITNFVELHTTWQKMLDTKLLNKKFFNDLSNWYFWAEKHVKFPADKKLGEEKSIQNNLIRLLTRMIFVWFLKEKKLIPGHLFDKTKINSLLKTFDPGGEKTNFYYKAILQNLFFGTLNQQMGQREFAKDEDFHSNKTEHGIKNKFRYAKHFSISEKEVLNLFAEIPFLNGGLFDCLDNDNEETGKHEYIDGFSRDEKKTAKVPDMLFFGEERELDLSEEYGYKRNKEKCRGLFRIFEDYKFTIEENTPVEEEIALDPELLGKVFENLLAYYNPETETTARKQTGSFYTPREIVNYMVDESLIAYLKTQLLEDRPAWLQLGNLQTELFGNEARKGQLKIEQTLNASKWKGKEEELEENLRKLIAYRNDEHPFSYEEDIQQLIYAIDHCKILDPACGSGAFPMGVLHKLVYVLGRLDENNTRWKELQQRKTQYEIDKAVKETEKNELQNKLDDIAKSFDENASDYGRKLYLIENCIYGVDIQPIAVQISKLRFFISLVVDQKEKQEVDNRGIRPLPNLETKFVAANTLIGLDKPQGLDFKSAEIIELENELRDIRHQHFEARTRTDKQKFQKKDKAVRKKIAEAIKKEYAVYEKSILKQIETLEQQLKLSATAKVKEAQKEKIKKAVQDIEKKIEKLQHRLLDKKAIDDTADKIARFDIYNQNDAAGWFEPEWMFGKELESGFDIVIGNPPYVSANNMSLHNRKELTSLNQYSTLKGKWDLYIAFTERSLRLLNKQGLFTFIIPFGFLNQPFAEELRKLVLKNFMLQSIVDLHEQKIFESATVPSCIPLVQNRVSNRHDVDILDFDDGTFTSKYKIGIEKYHSSIQNMFRTEDIELKVELLQKIKQSGKPLDTHFYTSTGAEIHGKEKRDNEGELISGKSKFAVLNTSYRKGLKPYIEGSDIEKSKEGRYSYPIIDKWLDYSEPENMRSPKFKDLFDSKKIIIRGSSGLLRILAIYDDRKIYTSHKCTLIINKSDLPKQHSHYKNAIGPKLKYLLAILNSKVIDFYYEANYGGFIDVYPNNLKELPIKEAEKNDEDFVVRIVDYILFLKKSDKASLVILFFDRLIDAIVYELYLPESIQKANCEVVEHLNNLPELKEGEDAKNLMSIEKVYKELSNPSHPVSKAMQRMQDVEEVKIIEGKK